MIKLTSVLFCLMISVVLAFAQVSAPDTLTDAQVAELIEQVKQIPVSRLDSALPRRVSVADWLQTTAGPGAKIGWALRYTDASATDGGRDFPTCVEADVVMKNGRSINIYIAVGTPGKVGNHKAFVFETDLMGQREITTVRHLSDLPAALAMAQEAANHSGVLR